jgi:hypothetical protein
MNSSLLFFECSEDDINYINGGAVAGGLAGLVLGGAAGMLVGVGICIFNGSSNVGETIWKTTVAFGLSGAAIGGVGTPV